MKLYIVLCNMSSCIKKKTNDKYKLIFEKQSLAFPLYIHRGKNSSHRHGAKQSKRQHLLHFLIPFSPHIFILISNLVHNDGLRALSSAALSGSRSCQREGLWRVGWERQKSLLLDFTCNSFFRIQVQLSWPFRAREA